MLYNVTGYFYTALSVPFISHADIMK